MRFYHRTDHEAARAILEGGFRDSQGTYLTTSVHTGVWLSDRPLDEDEGAMGDTLLAVDVPDDRIGPILAGEWIEEGKGYREFLVPAEAINRLAIVTVDDVDEDPAWAGLAAAEFRKRGAR